METTSLQKLNYLLETKDMLDAYYSNKMGKNTKQIVSQRILIFWLKKLLRKDTLNLQNEKKYILSMVNRAIHYYRNKHTISSDKIDIPNYLSNSSFQFGKKKEKENRKKNIKTLVIKFVWKTILKMIKKTQMSNAYIITLVNKYRDAKKLATWLKQYPDADIDYINDDGKTSLVLACLHGDTEIVKVLLRAGADTNILYRRSVLTWSAYRGYFEIVKLLLPHKKNVAYHIVNAARRASDYGHHQIVLYLVEKYYYMFSSKNRNVFIENMLSIGDIKGNIQNVLTLIQTYNINLEHTHYKLIIDILTSNTADIKINQTRSGMSALLYFMMKNKRTCCKTFIRTTGIDVNILFTSETPLLFAYTTRSNISTNIIKLLLQHKDTKVNFQDRHGFPHYTIKAIKKRVI